MVCVCGNQMSQFKGVGGGYNTAFLYITWELKYCDVCDRFVIEEYVAQEVDKKDLSALVRKQMTKMSEAKKQAKK